MSKMDDVLAAKRELLELLEEKARRRARTRLLRMYPEDGPLRREMYPKHMAFFRAGATEYDRCMMAANRVGKCLSFQTLIETRDGDRTIGELYELGKPVPIWAWADGRRVEAQASAPFKKPGLHQCYRVTMSDGRWFEGADQHRVLTLDGWRYLDELHRVFSGDPLPTSSGSGLRDPHADDLRCTRTASGCRGDCSGYCRRCGGRPLGESDSARPWLPSPADALRRIAAWWRRGGLAGRCTSSGRPASGLLSTRDALLLLWGPSSGFGCPAECTTSGWWSYLSRGSRQPCPGSPDHPRSAHEGDQRRGDIRRALQLPDVDGAQIVAIDVIGRNEVFDVSVPVHHNYVTAGVVHHNSYGVGGYETALHLTGRYPDWWEGRRFSHPIEAWASGDTSETTRDIVQSILMGPLDQLGTGLIPAADIIGNPSRRQGVTGAFDSAHIKHTSGGTSLLGFKSFDQGRKKFQGTAKHLIWLDEECPQDVHEECLLRLMTTNGMLLCTFTPLSGLSEVAMRYLQAMGSKG